MPRIEKRNNLQAIIVLAIVVALASFANWWDEHDKLAAKERAKVQQEKNDQRYINYFLIGGKP